MVSTLFQFLLSSALIIVAGIYLTKSTDRISEITGLGKLILGSLLLAGATSLTEIFVGINAVRSHIPELAVGNLLGASLINLFILATADLLIKSHSKKFSHITAGQALSASCLIIIITILSMGILLIPEDGGFIIFNASLPSYIIIATLLFSMRLIYQNQNIVHAEVKEFYFPIKRLLPHFAIFTLSAVTIIYACPILVDSADQIALITGLGDTFIGLTLVSIATSLPEMVATFQSVRMGSYELAFGNIIGSIAYNIIIIAVLDFVLEGSIYATIGQIHIFTCLTLILCIAIAMIGQLYQVERAKQFFEPDATLIIIIILISYYILYRVT